MKYDLYIFDLDNTLVRAWTTELLPGVEEWFRSIPSGEMPRIGIASNQGGVGLRHWIKVAKLKPSSKTRYPTVEEVEENIRQVAVHIIDKWAPIIQVRVCYAYQSKKGHWSPTPEGEEDNLCWHPGWRKPSPGMLLDIMATTDVSPSKTLMVGDQETDKQAAEAAGCDFAWAHEFFGREPIIEQMELHE
jgi:HAD superfamily hydrolase (TIGR01662 family)